MGRALPGMTLEPLLYLGSVLTTGIAEGLEELDEKGLLREREPRPPQRLARLLWAWGFRGSNEGFRVWDSGFGVVGPGLRIQVEECRITLVLPVLLLGFPVVVAAISCYSHETFGV